MDTPTTDQMGAGQVMAAEVGVLMESLLVVTVRVATASCLDTTGYVGGVNLVRMDVSYHHVV